MAADDRVVGSRIHSFGKELFARSAARRALVGLVGYRHVIFDFARVAAIGQGAIGVSAENTNDDVDFMIRRAGFVKQ